MKIAFYTAVLLNPMNNKNNTQDFLTSYSKNKIFKDSYVNYSNYSNALIIDYDKITYRSIKRPNNINNFIFRNIIIVGNIFNRSDSS